MCSMSCPEETSQNQWLEPQGSRWGVRWAWSPQPWLLGSKCHFLTVCPKTSCFSSLGLSFLICKMGFPAYLASLPGVGRPKPPSEVPSAVETVQSYVPGGPGAQHSMTGSSPRHWLVCVETDPIWECLPARWPGEEPQSPARASLGPA